MKLCFLGDSHAAQHLSAAAWAKGFTQAPSYNADVIFVSQDTPTDTHGNRDMEPIASWAYVASRNAGPGTTIVVTSQCEPGFTRSLGIKGVFHQAETLRIKDAAERALNPEMFIVGSEHEDDLPSAYAAYLDVFKCPVLRMSLEEAEFAKIAINMTLAAQVDNTNRLASAAAKIGVRWSKIAEVLRHDTRIGAQSYLTPGCWQDSPHLLRDWVTLQKL